MSLPDRLQFVCLRDKEVMDLGIEREIILNDDVIAWLNKHSKHGYVRLVKKARYK